VKNTGSRDGIEIAQVYASLPEGSGEPPKRLVGWSRVALKAGESKTVSVAIDPKYLSVYDEASDAWKLLPGEYTMRVGGSSADLGITKTFELK
jgi:beta-glucosidase